MAARPRAICNECLVDALVVAPLDLDWDGQPPQARGRLDPITVAPVASRVLHLVIEDERIDARDKVEVTLPRDVVRLDYRDAISAHCSSRAKTLKPTLP